MALILIANADHKFSDILRRVLGSYGHEAVTARTGEEALRLFHAQFPALVLLDLCLLGKPGLEVLADIRARAPQLPVVVVTGDIRIEMEDRARQLGVVDVLRRGLRMDVITQVVQTTLSRTSKLSRPVTPCVTSSTSKAETPAFILVVDDEPEIGKMVGEYLHQQGYRVQSVQSGEEALGIVRTDTPDLVLLDIYMPGIDGVEVLRQLQQINPSIGVIMLTASQEEPLLKTALDLGAFDVLSKPVDLDQLGLAVTVKLAMQE